jgi:hypothetical protein
VAKRKLQSDWDAIEREYRLGVLSIREIARSCGVSEGAIRKRAAAAQPPWLRNLAEQVRQATREQLICRDTRAGVDCPHMTDAAIVGQAAMVGVAVVTRQRKSVNDAHEAVIVVLNRVREAMEGAEELARAIDEAEPIDVQGEERAGERRARLKRRARLEAAVGIGAHIASVRDIAAALKAIIPLERVIYGIAQAGTMTNEKELLDTLVTQISGDRLAPVA